MSPPPRGPVVAAAQLARSFDEADIPYAIGGALALAAHGVPRMTTDVDLGVFVDGPRIEELLDALERAGCLFDRQRARQEIDRVFLFTVRCLGVLADVFVSDSRHPAIERRVRIPGPDGTALWYFSVEDYVVHKLALHRHQDLADLERLLARPDLRLDVEYIRRWLEVIAPDSSDPRRASLERLVR